MWPRSFRVVTRPDFYDERSGIVYRSVVTTCVSIAELDYRTYSSDSDDHLKLCYGMQTSVAKDFSFLDWQREGFELVKDMSRRFGTTRALYFSEETISWAMT